MAFFGCSFACSTNRRVCQLLKPLWQYQVGTLTSLGVTGAEEKPKAKRGRPPTKGKAEEAAAASGEAADKVRCLHLHSFLSVSLSAQLLLKASGVESASLHMHAFAWGCPMPYAKTFQMTAHQACQQL